LPEGSKVRYAQSGLNDPFTPMCLSLFWRYESTWITDFWRT